MSLRLHSCEKHYPAVEKEATAVIESVRRWSHFLKGRHSSIITDQRAISFMFDQRNRGKIKNSKILSWRLELSQLSYEKNTQLGAENVVLDAFSRICASTSNASLKDLHQSLGHPGFARLDHFVRQRNLPFSSEESKDVCRYCKTSAEVQPRYFKRYFQSLVKAIRLWDHVSVDLKGPVRGPRPGAHARGAEGGRASP